MITVPLYFIVFDLPETLMLSDVSFPLICRFLFSGRKQISNYLHKLDPVTITVEIERVEYFMEGGLGIILPLDTYWTRG